MPFWGGGENLKRLISSLSFLTYDLHHVGVLIGDSCFFGGGGAQHRCGREWCWAQFLGSITIPTTGLGLKGARRIANTQMDAL